MTDLQANSFSFSIELENEFPYIVDVQNNINYKLTYSDDFFTYDISDPTITVLDSGDLNLNFVGESSFGMMMNFGFNITFSTENTGKIESALSTPLSVLPDIFITGSLKEINLKLDTNQAFRLRLGGGMSVFTPPTTLNILKNDIGLYRVFVPDLSFIILDSGVLGIYFKDPYYYYTHHWIPFPDSWTSGIQAVLSLLL